MGKLFAAKPASAKELHMTTFQRRIMGIYKYLKSVKDVVIRRNGGLDEN
jgi:hypothetical protein